MIIAIAHTKPGPNAEYAYLKFEEGAKLHGDICVHIRNHNDIHRIKNCDVVFQVAYPFITHKYIFCDEFGTASPNLDGVVIFSEINNFRIAVFEEAIKYKKRLLCIDSALLGFNRRDNNTHYQISFDSIKGLGKYYNENSPPNRFKKLGIEIQPWRKTGNHILLFGQVRYGIGSQHIDVRKWTKLFVVNYHEKYKKGNRKIFFRGHPNNENEFKKDPKLKDSGMVAFSKPSSSLIDDMTNCWCGVTFCSHVIAECIVRGIPCLSASRTSMGYPLFHSDDLLIDCQNPKLPDREQWLYDLCYTQWHTEELGDGTAWAHYRPHALKTEDVNWDNLSRLIC